MLNPSIESAHRKDAKRHFSNKNNVARSKLTIVLVMRIRCNHLRYEFSEWDYGFPDSG